MLYWRGLYTPDFSCIKQFVHPEIKNKFPVIYKMLLKEEQMVNLYLSELCVVNKIWVYEIYKSLLLFPF